VANNRMFLCHRPSGLSINDWDVLDFCLCMEHAKESAMVLTRWNYGEPCGPLRLLNIDLEGAS
jgi:hypothetical protein